MEENKQESNKETSQTAYGMIAISKGGRLFVKQGFKQGFKLQFRHTHAHSHYATCQKKLKSSLMRHDMYYVIVG